MHVKRYEAATMAEAIRQVKAELGPEALILSQRTLRRKGGLGLFGRSVIEITAAVDRERRELSNPSHRESFSTPDATRTTPDPSWKDLSLRRALNEPLEAEVRQLRAAVEALAQSFPDGMALKQDLADLRRAAHDAISLERNPFPELAPHVGPLLRAGIAPAQAHAIAARALELPPSQERTASALAQTLERRLVPERAPKPTAPILFVGAAGVGKTTTLAKWVARESAKQASPISIATLDAHRVGADAPLRGVAKRLNLPCDTLVSPAQLAETRIARRAQCLFVDSPGANASDTRAIEDLAKARDAMGPGASVRLVVSATTKDDDLARQLERFRSLEPSGLVVTKLDECRQLGNVINLLLREGAPPLSWVGIGPHVPDDLVMPDPRELANQVLGVAS